MTATTTTNTHTGAAKIVGASVAAALLASTAMSGFGVVSSFWEGLAAQNPAAWAGLAILGGGLAASELGAVALAMAMTRDGITWARGALFGFCTVANVLAGHYGAEAINTRLVEPQRAPYVQALASAAAESGAARNSLEAFESRAADETANLERSIEAERAAVAGAVSARSRQARADRDSLATRQRAEREPLAATLAAAEQREAQARQALASDAPKGMDPVQMWALAALLECLKGLLVFAATPRRRKIATGDNVLSIDTSAFDALDATELAEIEARAASIKASAQWARKRKERAA